MRKDFIRIFLFYVALSFIPIFASSTPSQSKQQFCQKRLEPGYFNSLAYDPQNHMAFRNSGGIQNKGVCWWHALFQRAAWYLTVYRPELAKPTIQQVKNIVHQIAVGKRVVEIPGFANFHDFSKQWEPVIRAKLEEWQLVDGFLKFAWIEGLQGNNVVPPADLEKQINLIYHGTSVESNVQWVMLQMDGISSHGILSVQSVRYPDGMQLEVVDNNFVGRVKVMHYHDGAETMQSLYYGSISPYLGRTKDLTYFKRAADSYCSLSSLSIDDNALELNNSID